MDKLMKKFLKSSIISAIVLIAVGLLLIFNSEGTIFTISYVIGGILIAIGAVAIIKFISTMKEPEKNYDFNIVYGIVCIIMGVLVIGHPKAISTIISIILGVVIIASSATKLQYTLQMKKEGNAAWKVTMVIALISLLCGVVLVFNPFGSAKAITEIVGIFILIYAILDIISTLSIKKTFDGVAQIEDKKVADAKIVDEKEKPKKKTATKKKTTTKKTTTKNAKK